MSHTEIERLINQELTGSYYRLVPKRFAWTYPKEALTERIANLPRVQNAEISRDGTSVIVQFAEYVPEALFCPSLGSNRCLFLYQTGYTFANAPELTGSALLRYIDQTQVFTPGVEVFPQDVMDRTANFVTAASELGLNITAVKKTSQQELSYHIAGGGRVITSLLESPDDTIENLATILNSKEFQHLEPGNFQYIDLRFGSKVFVNEESEIAPLTDVEGAKSSATTTQEI